MANCDGKFIQLELFPFQRQVSGSHMVLEINRSLVGKPHFDNEENFYNMVPEELREFTPKYYGKIEVTCQQSEDTKFLADIPLMLVDKCRIGEVNGKTNHYENGLSLLTANNTSNRRWDPKEESEFWSRRRIEKFLSKWTSNPTQSFVVLENLLGSYEHPCILDIKLGKRKRAVYEREAKRQKKEGKCAKSTAATLSFTIGGIKMYKSDIKSDVIHGKEYCRALKIDDVMDELRFFFRDRNKLRYDVIHQIISKLNRLYEALSNQNVFYFFSSSLLIIYDNTSENIFDIQNTEDKEPTNILENGSIMSKESQNIDINETINVDHDASLGSVDHKADVDHDPSLRLVDHKADIRLIDFAHSAKRQEVDSTIQSNDEEILDGVKNLINYLERIK